MVSVNASMMRSNSRYEGPLAICELPLLPDRLASTLEQSTSFGLTLHVFVLHKGRFLQCRDVYD